MKSAFLDPPYELKALLTQYFGHAQFDDQGPILAPQELQAFAQSIKNLGFIYFVHCSAAHYHSKEAKAYFHQLSFSNPIYQSQENQLSPPQDNGLELILEEGFTVAYAVRNLQLPSLTLSFRTKALGSKQPTEIPSLSAIWRGADWQEREQYDLFGIRFTGHPMLQRIMLTEDWQGHPLRKDYAIDTPQYPWRSVK